MMNVADAGGRTEHLLAYTYNALCLIMRIVHCVSKNDNDIAHYNFNAH